MYRHQKHFCKEKYDKDEELRLANLKIEKLEKEDLFDLAKSNSQTANKSISTMSFIIKNCKDAPEIKRYNGCNGYSGMQ